MAKVVAAVGAPHTPFFPRKVQSEGPESETGGFYRQLRERLVAARPDLLVVFTSDHINKFFYDNLPVFCVGIEDEVSGPEPFVPMPQYRVKVRRDFATALARAGVEAEFDLATTEEFRLDHSAMVPLHFLVPEMQVPIVPVFIRGLITPLPKAHRCYALGQMVRGFIDRWPGQERVVVLASGSFSLEVGGPKIGVIDTDWTRGVMDCLSRRAVDELLAMATEAKMLGAGNVGGELLNWIALIGALGNDEPLEPDHVLLEEGHAYAFWKVAGA